MLMACMQVKSAKQLCAKVALFGGHCSHELSEEYGNGMATTTTNTTTVNTMEQDLTYSDLLFTAFISCRNILLLDIAQMKTVIAIRFTTMTSVINGMQTAIT